MILHLNDFSKGYSLLSHMQFLCFSGVLVQFANAVLVKTVWRRNGHERARASPCGIYIGVLWNVCTRKQIAL